MKRLTPTLMASSTPFSAKLSYGEDGNHDYNYDSEDDSLGDQPYDFNEDDTSPSVTVLQALLVFFLISCLLCAILQRDVILRMMHRRRAARAMRLSTVDPDEELAPVPGWFGMETAVVKVIVDLGTATDRRHTIGMARESIGSVAQLPFALSDALSESGFPELSGLDLVELLISKSAELQVETSHGDLRPVDEQTRDWDVARAKSFHVRVTATITSAQIERVPAPAEGDASAV
jgi:hypothetical protein